MMNETENSSSQFLSTDRGKAKSNAVEIPAISMPKGGGAIKGIDEKFVVNAVNGTASFSLPIPFSDARGASPELNLQYNSGAGNGVFGLGWRLSLPSIKRKSDHQLPQYLDGIDSDTFLLSESEDLVPEFKKETDGSFAVDADGNYVIREQESADGLFLIRYYKPRIEGLFSRIERWRHKTTGELKWRVTTKENVTTLFGWSAASRIEASNKIYEWLPELIYDDKGNCTHYSYQKEDAKGLNPAFLHNKNRIKNGYTNLYLEKISYGNKTPYTGNFPPESDYLFQTVFEYTNSRTDAFSEYKAGFEIRTTKLCQRVLVYHYFDELSGLVKSLDIEYETSPEKDLSFLKSVTTCGYIKKPDGSYSTKKMPPVEFAYQQATWNKEIRSITQGEAPGGVDEPAHQFTDLFNEGLTGILSVHADNWYYRRNLGGGEFEQPQPVSPKPSFAGPAGKLQLVDLDADGGKQFVSFHDQAKGYFELNSSSEWHGMRSFKSMPNINFNDPNTRMIDLDGDGKPEIVIADDQVFTWYQSEGRKGFGMAQRVVKPLNEEDGPHVVFADAKQSIFLADMSGDGMTDIVRIKNGDICYWPNLGYGKFGAKIAFDNAPVFDQPDAFNPAYIRLADIDGCGPCDIIYLGKNKFTCWKNLDGSRFSTNPIEIDKAPGIHTQSKITVADLFGNGMACIVWSGGASLHYINLMGGKKPYLMTGYKNNMGKEVSFEYTPSTQFYLADKRAGTPWVTNLHFPIHCVSKTITADTITGCKFVTEYRYHHGYYDHAEREFRGFGMVEQTDAESFEHWDGNIEQPLHQDPVVTKSWYHTGAFLEKGKILDLYAKDYWYVGRQKSHREIALPDATLEGANQLSAQEWREAYRACKGMELRSEVFATAATPLSVATHNGVIKLLQPRGRNKHAVFALNKSETRTYEYEGNPEDPRIAHTLNTRIDEYGHVLESATVVYPRLQTDDSLPMATQQAQAHTSIVYTVNAYTNDVINESEYRLRVEAEVKSYEAIVERSGLYYNISDFITIPSKTLIEQKRTLYYKNDLTGPLPLTQLESKGIKFEEYQLAYTPELLADIFGNKVQPDVLTEGGYLNMEGWWVRSGSAWYKTADETATDAQHRFYKPIAYIDPAGALTKVKYYGNYFLFIGEMEDAFGNKTTVEKFNFRSGSPQRMRNCNNNISETIYDELGMVKAMAVYGKGAEADDLTNLSEITVEEFDSFFRDPRSARSLLQQATTRFVYNLYAQPVVVATILREQHHNPHSPVQISFEYTNGMGEVIMTKKQATHARWIGSGRIVLNNKGNKVKEYEPYFSATHQYEHKVTNGVTPKHYYDASGRLIKTEMPDGSFSQVIFDSWKKAFYDANDTITESPWYTNRINRLIDAQLIAEGKDPEKEQQTAEKAALHANTPNIEHFDSLGRSVLSVEAGYSTALQLDVKGNLQTITDARGNTSMQYKYDLLGNKVYQQSMDAGQRWLLLNILDKPLRTWDERNNEFQYFYDRLNRPIRSVVINETTKVFERIIYGEELLTSNSREALQARNVLGQPVQHYDTAGLIYTPEYDFQEQPLKTTRQLFGKYKEVANWIDANLVEDLDSEKFMTTVTHDALKRLTTQIAPDGSITHFSYNESGLLSSTSVTEYESGITTTYIKDIDYNEKGQRNKIIYGNDVITRFYYDAATFRLNRLESTTRNNTPLQDWSYTYDPVGNISFIKDRNSPDTFFSNKKITAVAAYTYDALYRLTEASGRENNAALVFNNTDNWNDAAFMQCLHPGDAMGMRNYTQRYTYDGVGNVLQMQHLATGNNFTRTYQYDNAANRLLSTQIGKDSFTYTHHAQHGYMMAMPHLEQMDWNFKEELVRTITQKRTDGGTPETTYYQYDHEGKRIRKITEHQAMPGARPMRKEERTYIGDYERYIKYTGPDGGLKRASLSLTEDGHRFVTIETRNGVEDGTDKQTVRYQLHNHLGSAALELNNTAEVISYEEFHPYGTTAYQAKNASIKAAAKRFRYTGMERDEESGLEYHNARYYVSWLGRWLSCDPLFNKEEDDGPDLKNLNLYAYCSGNPIIYHDPTGLVGILQAWWAAYDKGTTGEKIGLGFLFLFAWIAHVIVNLFILAISITLLNPTGLFGALDFSWGGIQSILGLTIGIGAVLLGADVSPHKGMGAKIELPAWMGPSSGSFGFSLGPTIFGSSGSNHWDHEAGHTWQSRALGPFYLFIIAIPSIINAALNPVSQKGFYTEDWADAWSS